MRRLSLVLLGCMMGLTLSAAAWAASEECLKQRDRNALTEFTPPGTFLGGNFVADEIEPGFIFGKVGDFAKTRNCPTTWLIEEGEKKRIENKLSQSGPVEYTLYLEEDCPGKVTFFVFVDRSHADPAQWMQWRQQFHKSKAEPQYSKAKTNLNQAAQHGFPVEAELRFMEVNGELSMRKPEEFLVGDLKFQPIYDLKQGKTVSR